MKRAEIAILAFGAAFLVLLAVYFRSGQKVTSSAGGTGATPATGVSGAGPEGGEPTTLLSGFDYTESIGDKPLFRIRSDRTLGYGAGAGLPPNLYSLERVSLTVYPEDGPPVTVQSDRARYDDRTKAAVLSGNVRWVEPRDGALGETETIEFEPTKRLLRAPGALHFTRGTFDVTAASGAYDLKTRVLALAGPIRGSGTGQGSGGLSAISGDSGEYRRDEGVVLLKGNVKASSAKGDWVTADRMLLKFSPEGNAAEWARAFDSVRGALAPAPGGIARKYSADEGALFFDLSGDVRSLNLKGAPATVEEPGRRIAARSLDLEFAAGRPTSARANGDVSVRSDQGDAQAERGSAVFAASGAFQTLDLEGSVRLAGQGRKGSANRVVDLADRGLWILTGTPQASATVEEGGSRVSASRIEIDRARETLAAEGKARAVFLPGKDRAAGASSFLGDPSHPTFGKAERIVLDRRARLVTLSGGASLWQGSSSLFGDDITLNDAERTAVAVGKVRAVLARAPAAAATKEEPAVVSARRLVYRESESSAVFEDAVTVTRGTWRASADQGVAFFGKDRKLERVELSGGVWLADRATGRTATADRAIDYPNEGRTVLHGNPARVSDAEGNRVGGSTLTITGRGKNVEVTAPSGGRTETIHKTKSQ
ncbi:MAG: LPS export ABC transporter periplasmic protein LptC [Acidobacteriota bacterium]